MGLPRCADTDLPRLLCGCPAHNSWAFDFDDLTPAEVTFLEGRWGPPPIPEYRQYHLLRLDYASREWKYLGVQGAPEALVCDHGKPEGMGICPMCADDLAHLLEDVPALVADLKLALAHEVSFADQGAMSSADPDESPLPFNVAASKALAGLVRAFGGNPVTRAAQFSLHLLNLLRYPDINGLLARLSLAVQVGHRVIDRPPTVLYYGLCPKCDKDIRQEQVDPKDPHGMINCPHCDYSATVEDHQREQMILALDRWHTEAETLRILEMGGEPIARWEFVNIKKRDGLPVDKGLRKRWRNGRIEDYQVEVVRLRDVRELVARRRAARDLARGS